MEGKGFRKLLLRGLLGGGLGGFVWVAGIILMMVDKLERSWGQWITITYLLYGLPFGTFIGSIIATVIWLIHKRTRTNVSPFSRAMIGTMTALIVRSVQLSLENRVGYDPSSWQSIAMDVAFYGVAIGGVAGMIVGRQSNRDKQKLGTQALTAEDEQH